LMRMIRNHGLGLQIVLKVSGSVKI